MDLAIDDLTPEKIAETIEVRADAGVREAVNRMPGARSLILAEVFRCLSATKYYYSKSEGGMVHEPDYRTRLDAAKLLLAYVEGLPVATSLSVAVGDQPGAAMTLEEAADKSPALRSRLHKLLGSSTT